MGLCSFFPSFNIWSYPDLESVFRQRPVSDHRRACRIRFNGLGEKQKYGFLWFRHVLDFAGALSSLHPDSRLKTRLRSVNRHELALMTQPLSVRVFLTSMASAFTSWMPATMPSSTNPFAPLPSILSALSKSIVLGSLSNFCNSKRVSAFAVFSRCSSVFWRCSSKFVSSVSSCLDWRLLTTAPLTSATPAKTTSKSWLTQYTISQLIFIPVVTLTVIGTCACLILIHWFPNTRLARGGTGLVLFVVQRSFSSKQRPSRSGYNVEGETP